MSRYPTFHDLDADKDGKLLEQLHRDVLVPSFTPDELDTVQTMAQGLDDRDTLVTVALGGDGEVLGGAVGEIYETEQVLLLSYLAVRPGLRGEGIGTALLRHVEQRWYAEPNVRLALAEVHDPRQWPESADEHPLNRLHFYRRFSARVLAVPFVQPALREGLSRVPGFLLLAFHVDPSIEIDGSIPSDVVARFVRRYYKTCEGIGPADDDELAELLRAIEERPSIALLATDDYERVPMLA